jgi:hypothetical protein
LLTTYFLWVYFEQAILKRPLYLLSLANIKFFRNELSSNKLLGLSMSILSQLGDKFGVVACA